MKILVTGGSGQLGKAVIEELNNRNYEVLAPTHKELDIKNELNIKNYFLKETPDAIIHCAAFTKVDDAETKTLETFYINVTGTKNLVNACKFLYNPKFVYISTDYVYGNSGNTPLKPTDETIPQNIYGQSKLEGEKSVRNIPNHYIVRISWLFGEGNNFVKTILSLRNKEEINVVNDQIGRPTYTKDLSKLLVDMIETDKYGIYNVSNEGEYVSWAEFAEEIFRQKNIDTKVNSITSNEYKTMAKRPLNSRFDTNKLSENGFKLLPDWKDALKRFLND